MGGVLLLLLEVAFIWRTPSSLVSAATVFSTTVFTTALLTISLPHLLCSLLMNDQADHLHDCYYAKLSNCCLMHPQWQLATLALVVTVAVEAGKQATGLNSSRHPIFNIPDGEQADVYTQHDRLVKGQAMMLILFHHPRSSFWEN